MSPSALLVLALLASAAATGEIDEPDEPGSTPRGLIGAGVCADGAVAYLGVKVRDAGDNVKITAIDPGSPAALAGLAVGDRVVEVDGSAIEDAKRFYAILAARCPGQKINLRSLDDYGHRLFIIKLGRTITLADRGPRIAATTEREAPTSSWYGWKIAIIDGGAIVVSFAGLSAATPELAYVAIGAEVLAPAAVHAYHDNSKAAAGSVLLRLGAPIVGALLVRHIACGEDCDESGGEDRRNGFLVLGGAVGLALAAAIDIFAFSYAEPDSRSSP